MSRNTESTPNGAPVNDDPVDVAASVAPIATRSPQRAEPASVDGPSLIPDRSTMPNDPVHGEGASGSLSPEVAAAADLADPFGLDLDVAGTSTSQFGAGALELPDGPDVVDLTRTGELDVGVDWNDLGGGTGGTLDGRGIDTFEGGSNATGPADPSGMISDAASDLTTESQPATVGEWIGSFFGMSTDADEAFDKANEAAAKVEAGKGDAGGDRDGGGTDMGGLTTPGVKIDGDGVSTSTKAPTGEGAGMLGGIADIIMGKKNLDGSMTEREKQMQAMDNDSLPPDHPDYVGPPAERPPGSANDESIEQSIRQGLGGDRGGDVDPYDDPTASPTDGEAIYDPYDSVIDPGPDGFLPSGQIDASHLPDAIDLVDPYLGDG